MKTFKTTFIWEDSALPGKLFGQWKTVFVHISSIMCLPPYILYWGFLHSSVVENLPANAGDSGDMGLIPGSGRFPGGGHGNPLQYSCSENLVGRGAWQAKVHRITESQT